MGGPDCEDGGPRHGPPYPPALGTSFLAAAHVGYALALSAGVTVYVAASDLIPEVNREGGPALAWTVFGGLVSFVVADWALTQLGTAR